MAKTGSDVVRVSSEIMDEMRVVSRLTGTPLQALMDEAVHEWLETWGITMVESVCGRIKKRMTKNPNTRLTEVEQEVLDRCQKDGCHLHNSAPVPAKWRK